MSDRPTSYNVVDARTSKVVRSFKSRDRAYDFADARDQAFGAVRYTVQPVWPD